MNHRFLRRTCSYLIAICMLISLFSYPSALADSEPTIIEGDLDQIQVVEGDSVIVHGDINNDNSEVFAASASGSSDLTVDGNVTSAGPGIYVDSAAVNVSNVVVSSTQDAIVAQNEATVAVDGEVTGDIVVSGASFVTVEETLYGDAIVSGEGSSFESNNIDNSNGIGIQAYDKSTVNVTNDVTASTELIPEHHQNADGTWYTSSNPGSAVYANGAATVTIGGTVTNTNGNGISVYDATVYIGKDVIAAPYDMEVVKYDGSLETRTMVGNGISAGSNAVVNVNGNVQASMISKEGYLQQGIGITADTGATVTIEGSVDGSSNIRDAETKLVVGENHLGSIESTNADVDISNDLTGNVYITGEDASLTVGGDVNYLEHSGGRGITLEKNQDEGSTTTVSGIAIIVASKGSNVEIEGSVNAGATYSDLGDGVPSRIDPNAIIASDENTSVSVGGDVTAQIKAINGASIAIEGDLSVDPDAAFMELSATMKDGEFSADMISEPQIAIVAKNNAEVTVKGQTTVTGGSGILAENNSVVTVNSDVEAGANGITSINDSAVTVNGNISAKESGIIAADGGVVNVDGSVSGSKNAITAESGSNVTVTSTAEGRIIASGDSTTVTVEEGDVAGVTVSEGATVNVAGTINGSVHVSDEGSTLNGATGINSGSVGLIAENNAIVYIAGNIDAHKTVGIGVYADNNSAVTVDGNVTSDDTIMGTAVSANNNSSVVVNGDVESPVVFTNAVDARNNSSIEINGNLNGTIVANGEGSSITVSGDVKSDREIDITSDKIIYKNVDRVGTSDSDGTVVYNEEDRTLTVDKGTLGDADPNVLEGTVVAEDGATVVVEGTVDSALSGAYATDEGTITIGSDVTAGKDAIVAADGGSVNVDGDVTAGETGISTANGGSVDVQGDVTSDNVGIQVTIGNTGDEQSSVVVNGTVDGANKAVEISVGEGIDTSAVIAALPQIIVQTLETEGDLVAVTAPSDVDQGVVMDALVSQLYYIVNEAGVDTANISVYGAEEVDGYVVAKETTKLTLKSTNDGYVVCGVSAGNYATVEENDDGSYTITVERGGDLTLVASVKEKETNTEEPGTTEPGENTDPDPSNPDNPVNPNPDNLVDPDPSNPGTPDKPDDPKPGNHGRPDKPGRPDDHGSHGNNFWPWSDVPNTPWQNNGNDNPHNTGNGNDKWFSEYVMMPDYQSMILTINLIGRSNATILRTDLEVFQRAGFASVNIVTEDASLFMAMSNLLELYGGSSRCTFVRNGNSVELWVRDALIVTVTLVKQDKKAA